MPPRRSLRFDAPRRVGCALLVLVLAAACGRARGPDVIVIVLDTARPDYLSVYGHRKPTTPYLETFAREGTLYTRAYSSSSWTLPAHASLFTGLAPGLHGATQGHPSLADDVPTLAERLRDAGYRTAGFSNNPWVSEATGLARGFERFRDKWNLRARANDPAREHPTVKAVDGWFAGERDRDRPAFLFVNLIEPHMPYDPTWEDACGFVDGPEQWAGAIRRFFLKGDPFEVLERHYARDDPLTEREWEDLRRLYEGDLLRCDRVTQAILRIVDRECDPASTLVFLVSDHGENFGDHGHVSHLFNLYDSNLRIALLARGAGFEAGRRETALVQIADVCATILRAAGLEPDAHSRAVDLRAAPVPGRVVTAELDRPVVSLSVFRAATLASGKLKAHERDLQAAVGERFKVIRSSDGSEEIYDLLADPDEERPLARAAVGEPLLEHVHALLDAEQSAALQRRRSISSDPARPVGDPEALEALRRLGYVK